MFAQLKNVFGFNILAKVMIFAKYLLYLIDKETKLYKEVSYSGLDDNLALSFGCFCLLFVVVYNRVSQKIKKRNSIIILKIFLPQRNASFVILAYQKIA